MDKSEYKGYLLILAAGSLWGTIGIFVTNMASHGSSAALTSFLRMLLAFVLLASISIVKYKSGFFKVDLKTILLCAALGILCQAGYNIFYCSAISLIGISVSSVLLYVSPVFTAIMAKFLLYEKITRQKLIGLIVNVVGCSLTVTGGNIFGVQLPWLGILFGLGAGACYSLVPIIGKFAAADSNPFVLSTYSYFFAAIFLAFFSKPWLTVTALNGDWIMIAVEYALIPTAIAYFLYYSGLQKVKESSKIPVMASVEAVVASLIGISLFKESIGIGNGIGILLVLSSIVLMNSNIKKI